MLSELVNPLEMLKMTMMLCPQQAAEDLLG